MKKKVISFIVALALAVPTALGAFPRFLEGAAENPELFAPVEINAENFPDDTFREYILEEEQRIAEEQGEESDQILSVEEIEQITSIDVQDMWISSLDGIEYLTSLVSLNCSDNMLFYLDVSNLTNLEELICEGNSLSALDLSGNPNLKTLNCDYNYISNLVLSDSDLSLSYLSCEYNSLTDIELSSAITLETLHLNGNQIENIDLGMLSELTDLQINGNKLRELNLNGNPKLSTVYCAENYLTDLDLSLNTLLTELNCSKNRIAVLDVSNNTELTYLDCSFNYLTSLDLEENILIEELYCGENRYEIFSCYNEAFNYILEDLIEKLPNPNFDVTKTSHWSGAERTEDGTTFLNIENNVTEITYTYNMGNGHTETFTLAFKEGHNTEIVADTSSLCIDKTAGVTDLWQCTECERYFADEAGTAEVTEMIRFTHELGEDEVKKAPTCSDEGVVIRTCEHCGYIEYDTIATIEHTFDDSDGSEYECSYCQHWKVCTECGQEFDLEYHDVDPKTNTCVVCGKNFDHYHNIYDEYVPREDPTCTEPGMKAHYYCPERRIYWYEYTDQRHIAEIAREDLIIDPLGHDYVTEYDDENHWQECTRCGDIEEDSIHAHTLDEVGVVAKPATCGEDGIIKYPCLYCAYAEEEVIPTEGTHSFTNKFKDLPELDQHVRICDNCGAEEDQTFDHDDENEIVDPTCFEKGKIIHTCKDCRRVKIEEVGEPTGEHNLSEEYKYNIDEHWRVCENKGCTYEEERGEHEWDEGVITVEPTVDNPGVRVFTCTVCQYEKSEWVDRLEKPEESTGPEISQPEITQPEITQPEITQPEITQPEITQPEITQPEISQPEITQPETTQPETTQPEITQPETTQPETTQPEATQPEPTQPTWPIQPTQPAQTTQSAQTTAPEKDPVESKPAATEPTGSRPASTNSIGFEPAATDPAGSTPAATNSTSKEPDVVIPNNPADTDKTPSAASSDNNMIGNVDGTGDSNKGDNNISTGLVISVIPAAISGALVVISKKRNKRK